MKPGLTELHGRVRLGMPGNVEKIVIDPMNISPDLALSSD